MEGRGYTMFELGNYLTLRQAARCLGISVSALRCKILKGELKSVSCPKKKVRNRCFITIDEIDAFLNGSTENGTAENGTAENKTEGVEDTMNNNLPQIFNYQGSQVRIVEINGEPFFVAKDACDVLDMSDVSMTLKRLDEDEKGTSLICTPGGTQRMAVVNEPGLYSLILGSRKPEAKAFKRWVTHEVIPAIRKTGAYSIPKVSQAELMHMMTTELVRQEKALVEVKTEVKEVRSEVTDLKIDINDEVNSLHSRIDLVDNLSIQKDNRQKLVAMIGRYVHDAGVSYGQAWNDFKQAFNTAYRTNLDLRITWFVKGNSLTKRPTIPDYLEKTGWIIDGLRVADKMLASVRKCS
jgi:prophage antirepressor-like protein